MPIEDLEKLVQKESFKIVVVHDRKFFLTSRTPEKLRKDIETNQRLRDRSEDNFEEFIRNHHVTFYGVEHINLEFYGPPTQNNVIMLVQDKDQYRVFFTNIDFVNHKMGGFSLPSIDMVEQGEAEQIQKEQAGDYIKELREKHHILCVLKVVDKVPNNVDVEQKKMWASMKYIMMKQSYEAEMKKKPQ